MPADLVKERARLRAIFKRYEEAIGGVDHLMLTETDDFNRRFNAPHWDQMKERTFVGLESAVESLEGLRLELLHHAAIRGRA